MKNTLGQTVQGAVRQWFGKTWVWTALRTEMLAICRISSIKINYKQSVQNMDISERTGDYVWTFL